MALFNHLFPYSNLHDINLDWIISIIKSIDPAVIQALQELTPDIIEQVNQKVSEAQAAAIAAQSSASEANTAKENAATSATEAAADAATANADAVRAENAKTAVENSLNTLFLAEPTMLNGCSLYSSFTQKMGKWLYVQMFCGIASGRSDNKAAKFDVSAISISSASTLICFIGSTKTTAVISIDGTISVDPTYSGDGYIFGMVPLV